MRFWRFFWRNCLGDFRLLKAGSAFEPYVARAVQFRGLMFNFIFSIDIVEDILIEIEVVMFVFATDCRFTWLEIGKAFSGDLVLFCSTIGGFGWSRGATHRWFE